MKLVIREEVAAIGEVRTSEYTVITNPVKEYYNISMNVGQAKGDLIVFRGPGNPVRFPAGSVNGKTLLTDNTSPTGWVLGDGGGGGGASATLTNNTGATMLAGTVVYAIEVDGKLEAYKADSLCDQRLYVLNDDVSDGEEVEASFVPGSVASVLCDTNAVAAGDPLQVGSNAGMAAPAAGNPTLGYALGAKAAGSAELVKVRLVENTSRKGINKSGASNTIGNVYRILSGDSAGVPLMESAAKGKQPFGVQVNPGAAEDAGLLLKYRSGEEAVVRADATEIWVGDWLVPSATTPGMVRAGNGYGIGYALESKAEGETGLVRCLLMPGQYGISPRCWYLPSGITEDQVMAAYQFIGRASEAEALININNGTEYPLTKQGSVIWNADSGFYIPATDKAGLDNTEIRAARSNINAGAFGYAKASTANSRAIGGILLYNHMSLFLQGYGTGSVYMNYPSINKGKSTVTTNRAATKKSEGVLAGHFNNGEIYLDGEILSVTDGTSYSNTSYNFYQRVIGQSAQESTNYSSFYVTALVLFTTTLNAEQHLELSQNIHHLGGIDI